jgi:uncharacterized lipoprotein YddW (UPF0748 family)
MSDHLRIPSTLVRRRGRRAAILGGFSALAVGTLFLATCVSLPAAKPVRKPVGYDPLPSPEREFRGLWVATVSNLDWPSARGLGVERQKAEALAILDKAAEFKLNAVLFQVRPTGDAYYRSKREPWSIGLSGTMGQDPGWDPLEFWVDEAHRRGLQLHAWFNPFRVGNPAIKAAEYSVDSLPVARPDWVRTVGTKGYRWLDPGEPAAVDHVLAVLGDIVDGYDIDGLVMDDYFYPYRDYYEPGEDFDDAAAWERACRSGFVGTREDWRRDNLDRFVERCYAETKARKPRVLVGISPFGIWRPDFPRGIAGKDSWAEIHTDTRFWLNQGWLDYLAPQLYWPIRQTAQSLPALLEWWKGENLKGRHLWPALNLAAPGGPALPDAASRAQEFASQLLTARGMLPSSPGFVLFRADTLMETVAGKPNPDWLGQAVADELKGRALSAPALVPASPWLDSAAPAAPVPRLRLEGDLLRVEWDADPVAFRWVVYTHRAGSDSGGRVWWSQQILDGGRTTAARAYLGGENGDRPIDKVIVTAVSRSGVESPKQVVAVPVTPAQAAE